MRRKKNKKGFTLVEVLAVLVILGILLSIATLAVSGYIQRGKRDYYHSLESNILTSGRDYLLDYKTLYPRVIGNSTVISIDELVKNKYISQPVDEDGKACTGDMVVIKTSANKYDYHVCIKCGDRYTSTTAECGYVEEVNKTQDYDFTLNGNIVSEILQGHDYILPTATVKDKNTGSIVVENLNPTPSSIDTTVLGETSISWRYRNDRIREKIRVIDKVSPTIEQAPKIYYNNGNDYNGEITNKSLVIRLKAKDYACETGSACRLKYPNLEGSGIKAVYYRAANYASEVKYNTTKTDIVIPLKQSTWGNLSIIVEDEDGNRREAGSVNVQFDNTVPAKPTLTYLKGASSSNWQKEINIQLSASDNIEIAYYEIYVDGTFYGTTGNTWTPPNNFSSDNVKFRAVDVAKNKGPFTDAQKIHMDTEKPSQTTVSLNGYTSGSWTKNDVKQTFTATDNTGVAYYEYANSNTATTGTRTTNPWTINTDGTYTLYIRAVDEAGNAGPWSDGYVIKRDTAVPEITFVAKKATAGTEVASGTWSNQNLSGTITVKNIPSGSTIYYCTDTANSCTPGTKYTGALTISTQGTSYVRYKAVSGSDVSKSGSYTAKIDTGTPSIKSVVVKKVTAGTTVSSGSWSNQNLSATITANSSPSGQTIYYCKDTANSCTPNTKYTGAITIDTAGISYLRYKVTNGVNTSSVVSSYNAKIDTVATPSATFTAKKVTSGTEVASGTWSNENLTATLSASAATSGTTIYYCTDTENSCNPTTEYTAAFAINTQGTSYVRFKTTTGSGISSSVSSYTAKVDTAAAPTATITAKKVTAGTTVSSGSWSNENLSVTFSAATATSGTTIYYCTDTANSCTPSTKYTGAVTVSTAGTSYVRYKTATGSGNSSSVSSYTAKVDTATSPAVTLTAKKVTAGTTVASGSWSNENLTATLSASAVTSGTTIYYCTDTANSCTPSTKYTGAITISTAGTSYIRYKSTTGAGNSSSVSSYTAKVDTAAAPTATITAKKASAGTTVASGSWSNENLSVTFSAVTATSGTTIYYCTDTADTCTPSTKYTGAVTVSTAGTSYVRYKTTTGSGNSSSVSSYTAKVDTAAAPAVTLTAKKVTAGTSVSSGSWSNQNLSVTLSATAATSGTTIYYCTDTANTCTPSTKYTGAITISTAGTSYIRYKSTTGAGNSSSVSSYTSKIDTAAAPTPSITAKKATAGTAVSSGSWSNQNLSVTLSATAATSGTTIYYCTDTANSCNPTTKYTAAFTVSTSGTSYVRYKTTTGSGNSSSVKSYTAKVDTKTPTITAKSNPISLGSGAYTFTSNVTVTYGVAGGTTTCDPASSKGTGTYTVTCTATGNNGSSKSVSFSARHSYAATATCPNGGTLSGSTCSYTSNESVCGCQTYKTCSNSACGTQSCCSGGYESGWCCNGNCSCYVDYVGGSSACSGMCGSSSAGNPCCSVCGDGTSYQCQVCKQWGTCNKSCATSACGCKTAKSCTKTPTYSCPNGGTLSGSTCNY